MKKAIPFFFFTTTILAALIFFSPSASNAGGPQSASVSATVLPTPENTKPKREKNFFEKMDPAQQLTVGSGAVLGTFMLVVGLFYATKLRKNSLHGTMAKK